MTIFLISNHGGQKWHSTLQIQKEKNYEPRILHPVKLSLRNKWEIKILLKEGKLKFVTSRHTLKGIVETKTIKKGIWEFQEGRKENSRSKSMGKPSKKKKKYG